MPPAPESCDLDGDGYDDDDCDNQDPAINPGAPELCDGIDNDCDNRTDEEVTEVAYGGVVYYGDGDQDGYGNEYDIRVHCPPAGMSESEVAGDCNDFDGAIHPGATDVCGSVDEDCDGILDEDCVDLDGDGAGVDGDGFGSEDCDDTDPTVHPWMEESCNGKDDDCNGLVDEGCDTALPTGDTGTPAGPSGTEVEETSRGCGGGRALALILPLGLLGRLRRRR